MGIIPPDATWRSELSYLPGVGDSCWQTPTTTGAALWFLDGNAAASQYLHVALDPRDPTASFTMTGAPKTAVPAPCRVGLAVSLGRRSMFQRAWIGMVGATETGTVAEADASAVLAGTGGIVVASSIATITTTAPHGLTVGSRVVVADCADPRQNSYYTVTGIPTTTSFTFTPLVTTSATYGTTTTIYVLEVAGHAADSFGILTKDASSGNAETVVRYSGGTPLVASWNPGSTWDNATIPTGYSGSYTYALQATKYLELQHERDWMGWGVWTVDSASAPVSTLSRDQGVPTPDAWVPRIEFANSAHLIAPIGRVTSISKTASTTATVTCPNHGLTVTDWVSVQGVRDQTSFANSSAVQVASVVDANTFTVIFGASTTATSYGGTVYRSQANTVPVVSASAVQTAQAQAGRLMLTFAASQGTWTVGEVACVVGLVDSTNTPQPAYEGLYRVARQDTTLFQVELEPLQGQALPGAPVTCGGSLLAAPALRLHYARGRTSTDFGVTIESSKSTSRAASSVPVTFSSGTTLGTVTTVATVSAVSAMTPVAGSSTTVTATASTNATSVKTTAGQVFALIATNYSAAPKYVKLYNKASAPTVGTDQPVAVLVIPATSSLPVELGSLGLRFTTGIALAITGAMPASDTTATAAGDVVLQLTYN